ncbi:1-deoxy-D-xylulose-5-phosphate reductoisomerase [Parvibaculum sedimenti]|uniref:1-deoxy-D-xylulose 5-phosphate reductoisomerase n=2 Tax=Parvibaculum sedimenti TaxID=2608632 RepID=A0A6N6VJ56_9HYPH|nr:1-deoxy-D-xylulose-5-phosphate reductoisomerase [Parvibaculum sedimenti]KAB7739306.1 1-deoxy-D-xylulose-5-phosphate reductoisomerase [Parvibaculum sedimenti]
MALTAEISDLERDRAEATRTGRPRSVTVLGSTGSIGCSTLDLIERERDRFELVALTAHKNVDALIEQARRLKPQFAVIADALLYEDLKAGLEATGIEVGAGRDAVVEAALRPADWVMAGIVGAAGLAPTLAAVRRGACVALANKECLVSAGPLFLAEVARSGTVLLPVDSEHNAIFQVLDQTRLGSVDKIILTASGGPFRTWSLAEMAQATPEQAVAHPRWSMGAKISVDSATLMNKGLELIEAHYLFPVGEERLDIVIHPESIIHSMVGYVDGSVLAQLGSPDMRTPISYALAWPDRMATPCARLNLAEIGKLTFEAPDPVRFPAIRLARAAVKAGGLVPTILNAANEVAVASFLERRIGFLDIAGTVESVLSAMGHESGEPDNLEHIYEIDGLARIRAEELVQLASR